MALEEHIEWFKHYRNTPRYARLQQRPVAYFCAEFALTDEMPIYSGGLGVLAGDVVREAADRGLPMIGVGLYYNYGYICKSHEEHGEMTEMCESIPPERVGLQPVVDASGNRVHITVPIKDGTVSAQVWYYDVPPTTETGVPVRIHLLDTNISENNDSDRSITDRLYVGDKETRLKQEILLGVGGLRLLETLGIHPAVYHLNEGHSAFLTLELIRHQMEERNLNFEQAKQFARRRVVFTNHTLVPAGNEVYDNDLVALMFGQYCQKLGIPPQAIIDMGLVHESSTFSMTMMSMRMSGIVNGVSQLHAEKAKDVWSSHPMVGITNGIHVPMWDALAGKDLSPVGAFWSSHQEKKRELLAFLAEHTGRRWNDNTLLLGWARRITQYKRPLAIMEDATRFAALARNEGRPMRLVIAGRPHPSDVHGAEMLKELRDATGGDLKDIAVYVPEYSLLEAQQMVAGCDVWMNTPILGFEASGTSGMKAALNGVLPFSTKDGWVAEVDLYGVGWPADSDHIGKDLLDVLERNISPLYYDRDANGVPRTWEQNMRNAREMVLNRFSATRMLREYAEILYA